MKSWVLAWLGLVGLLACVGSQAQTSAAAAAQPAPQTLSHGRFADLTIYRPAGPVTQVVLLLSGADGWKGAVIEMARVLQQDGALVVGINTASLFQDLEKDDGSCVFPDGDLENLSHFVQAYYQLPNYRMPLLVGYAAGATLAYAVLAQAPPQTFAGALSLGFCANLELRKPLCQGESVRVAPRRDRQGVDLLPSTALGAPWIVLQGEADQVCNTATAQRFASQVADSEFVVLPQVAHDYSLRDAWLGQFHAAIAKLGARQPQAALSGPQNLGDLPIIEVTATGESDQFAVLLSGDGGWAGLDKDVASALADQGIPVVGLDSLRYFWTARTPPGTAADIDRIVRYYLARWHKRNVILIGYSQGADVLPFVVNRLSAATKKKVRLTALLGLGTRATFEFHLSSWISAEEDGLPIRPEIDKLAGLPTLCLYGEDEEDSPCPELASGTLRVEKMPGGHHFGGEYDKLARLILKHAGARGGR